MSKNMDFARSVRSYFEGVQRSWAVDALEVYCDGRIGDGWTYSGGWFERLAAVSSPDSFTATDLVAVSMLSVDVPAHASILLLGTEKERFSHLLAAVGPDRPIWEAAESDLANDSPAGALWAALRKLKGIGRVTASKLMAVKRPALIPIYDQHVASALGLPDDLLWLPMRRAMLDAHELVASAVQEAGVSVTPLRAVDIVVWMHQHGHTYSEGQIGPPLGFNGDSRGQG